MSILAGKVLQSLGEPEEFPDPPANDPRRSEQLPPEPLLPPPAALGRLTERLPWLGWPRFADRQRWQRRCCQQAVQLPLAEDPAGWSVPDRVGRCPPNRRCQPGDREE